MKQDAIDNARTRAPLQQPVETSTPATPTTISEPGGEPQVVKTQNLEKMEKEKSDEEL